MTKQVRLPPPEKKAVNLGFMRLSDSAPLILAKELGLYEELGLDVSLSREVSWANLRDRLVMGDLDAAQLLAPLPMMTSYGAGGIRAKILTGLSLSLNGNAITLSNRLYEEIMNASLVDSITPRQSSNLLQQILSRSEKHSKITIATVHLFSTHTFLLRTWLKAGGIDPDRDLKIIVLPPEQMCDSLARGIIDGYCVGEPWNTIAVEQGIGSIICSGYRIWNNAPEKVLGVTEDWHGHHPGTHVRMRIATMKACRLLASAEQRREVASLLAKPEYLDLPEKYLLPSLTGEFRFSKNQPLVTMSDFHVFWQYQAGFPWRSHAYQLVTHCAQAFARSIPEEELSNLVQQSYRTDLYREAARLLRIASPSRDYKKENTHSQNWEFEQNIEMGPDKILSPME